MGEQGALGGSSLGGALGGTSLLQYDTGLFMSQRGAVRKHLVAALAPLAVPNGGYLHKIGTLPAPLKGAGDEDLGPFCLAMAGRSPCVLIALGRGIPETIGTDATEVRKELEIVIYAVSGQARSFIEGRLDTDAIAAGNASADPGIETLLEHIEQLVMGQELDLSGVSELRQTLEDEVATLEDVTIWQQRYRVNLQRDINRDRAIASIATSVDVKNKLDGADPVNPIVETVTNLETP